MSHGPHGVRPSGTHAASSSSSSSSTTTTTPQEAPGEFGRWQVSVAPMEGGPSPRSVAVDDTKHGAGGPAGGGAAVGLAGAAQVHPTPASLLDRGDLPHLLDALPSTHHGGRYDEVRAALVDYLRHRALGQAATVDQKAVAGGRNLAIALARLEKACTADLETLERALTAYLGRLRIPLIDSRAEPEMDQLLREVRLRLAPTQAGLIAPLSLADLGEDSDGLEDPEASDFRTAVTNGTNGTNGTNCLHDDPSDEDDLLPLEPGGSLVRSVATWHVPPQPPGVQGSGAEGHGEAGASEGAAVQAALQVTDDTSVSSSGNPTPQTPASPRHDGESPPSR